jgi:hypothetical protein
MPAFIEKDYWITLLLNRLSKSINVKNAVFKGGTSLSSGLKEIVEPEITSKGSMFRKSLFGFPTIIENSNIPNRVIVEINAFANPYPFVQQQINSFITDFLVETNRNDLLEEYNLYPFSLNVLDKRRTMIEKLVSLVRFSFLENPTQAIAGKIRHFYDLYYLAQDAECTEYIQSTQFKTDFSELLAHDKEAFDTPEGWRTKEIAESPLVTNFPTLWESLRTVYQNELTQLAFSGMPKEEEIAQSFERMINYIHGHDK